MEEQTTNTTAEIAPVVKYTLSELKAAARKLFNCSPDVLEGAVYGKNQDTFTVEEMRTFIDKFLKQPIK